MIPDNVEKIIMTKEDYDRNVEQLLVDKCKADKEIERLNNIIEQIKEYIEYSLNNPFADERMILEMVLAKIKVELKGDNK